MATPGIANKILVSFIGILLLVGIGTYIGLDRNIIDPGVEQDAALVGNHSSGETDTIEIPEGQASPTVKLQVTKDPKSGWNLQAITENFTFRPEYSTTEHIPGEGHIHFYIDGEKVPKLTSGWYHIPMLATGTHTIRVSLNANTHEAYAKDGEPIEDSQIVEVQ